MCMRSKRYLKFKSVADTKKKYSLAEAVEAVKKTAGVKFDATVEMHVCLGIDPKKGEEQVRGTIVLPHAFGKSKIVAAFVPSGKEDEAKAAGADLVGGEELIEEIAKSNKINFDVAVALPAMMPKLAKIAKILGPKGLMPNPKTETVGPDIKKLVGELKKGKMSFKNDDTGNIHLAVGKISFDSAKLTENAQAALDAIIKGKPISSKGTYLKTVVLTSTMGPAIKLAV
ncbi:MAG TPA: 50S ribosomal protein L1 [Candidatus Magasanikbacteria bacterium]|nr:50S ribosomal protein L1 [Candidatus Magasanikbacteria bacterium]HBX16061.1 50S ribosomal protein L1 [Candidatus Magasanikbacteria bacterium]